MTLTAGDHFFVPVDTMVTWEVFETFRKAYAMYETSWVDGRFY